MPSFPLSPHTMRILTRLALGAAFLAAPASAQISFAPLLGYDIDYESLTLGVAFELGTQLPSLPLQPSIRPSVEYVFGESEEIAGVDVGSSAVRVDVDLVGRLAATPQFQPYLKLGPTIEFLMVDVGNDSETNTEVGLNLGGGLEFNRVFVEGALGLGDISDVRIRAGYRF